MSEVPPPSSSLHPELLNSQDLPINIIPFLFPLHIEPEYEAFRVDYCDRLLSELYSAQRKCRIQELKSSLQKNESLYSSMGDFQQKKSSERVRKEFPSNKIVPGTQGLSVLNCSPVTTPISIQTSDVEESDDKFKCMECPSFLRSAPLSIFRSPSTAGYPGSPSAQFSPTELEKKCHHSTTLYPKKRTKELSFSSITNFSSDSKFSIKSTEEKLSQKISTQWSSSKFDTEEMDDDEDIRVSSKKSPALRYGRNSGLRRLEDFRKRIQSFRSSELAILEEEIVWELRLGPNCPIWSSINTVADRTTGLAVSTSSLLIEKNDAVWGDSKLFYFGGKWWRLQFGTKGEAPSMPCESRFFFFKIIPAELVTGNMALSAEFRVYPPAMNHDGVNADGNMSSEKENPGISIYRKIMTEDIHFSSYLQSTYTKNSLPIPCEEFISWKEFMPYISATGTVKLSVLLKSEIDKHGSLIGCFHTEHLKPVR